MATTESVELTSLAPTPSSGNSVTSSQPAQTPLPLNTTSSSTNATFNTPQIATPQIATPQIATPPTQTLTTASLQPRTSWFSLSRLKKILTYIAQIFIAIAGLFAAYVALSLAAWTSVKDFRDDCRNQNVIAAYFSLIQVGLLTNCRTPTASFLSIVEMR
jgi:hypothetical protein